jgi:hypothetical protein
MTRFLRSTWATPGRRASAGLAVVVALTVGLYAALGAGANNTHGASPLKTAKVANFGPVNLLPSDVRALARFSQSGDTLGNVTLLGTRDGQSFYRIENSTGAACYGVGDVHATDHLLGQILCAPDFPSAQKPILDFTVIHGGTANPAQDRVWRSNGIAAAGVNSIAFQTADGRTVGATPVVNGIYSVRAVPTVHVTNLIAKDPTGKVIYSTPASR